ncbi:hypothetical protein ACEZCY_14020 [Streptacidiphilus sp. N1-12]|uniref:Uncharacterized protein n=2 Tax=Streptacidiphilus alkalitolerans TaxID=3342712 RepID=A0ABV6V9H4_9ACTN
MPDVRHRAALAAVTCEAAPIIASALADISRPNTLQFTYTACGVIVTATTPQHLADAGPTLQAAFEAALWGVTTGYGPGTIGRDTRINLIAPDTLLSPCAPEARCLYCGRPTPAPIRGCCSAHHATLEHDRN